MSIFAASSKSTVLGDLYSLQQFIYESGVGPGLFYFKLEEGSFQRPAFYIKLVESTVDSFHRNFRWIKSEIMIQYFTEDYYDAQTTAADLQLLLSGSPLYADVVLPRYDFSESPPIKRTTSGYDIDHKYTGSGTMGARIDPQTVSNGGIVQEANRAWNAPITFTMVSPVPTFQDLPTMENIDFEFLTGMPNLAQVTKVCVRGVPSVEIELC